MKSDDSQPQQTSPKVRALIVDDEEPARRLLREYLADHPHVEIVGECANGFEAVKAVSEKSPDLLLLDIQMPKLNGFEVLDLLDIEPAVVFTTAYDEHALHAFEVNAVDYLLKPFAPERLEEAIARVLSQRGHSRPLPVAALAASSRPPHTFLERILVRERGQIHVLPVGEIDYFEARDDYVLIKIRGQEHLKQQRLAELERALDPSLFVRVHRSYLLNVERLAKIELKGKDSRIAVLTDGTKLPVSRTGYSRLRDRL